MTLPRPLLTLAAVAAALAAVPASALAADQVVSGTTLGSEVAIGVPLPASFGTALGGADPVDTTGGTVAVTAIGGWTMSVLGTDDGKLHAAATGCTGSTSVLNNAMEVFPTATLGNFTTSFTTSAPLTLSGTAQDIASGTGSNVVTMTYRQAPSASDQLAAGCVYTGTSTVNIAGT